MGAWRGAGRRLRRGRPGHGAPGPPQQQADDSNTPAAASRRQDRRSDMVRTPVADGAAPEKLTQFLFIEPQDYGHCRRKVTTRAPFGAGGGEQRTSAVAGNGDAQMGRFRPLLMRRCLCVPSGSASPADERDEPHAGGRGHQQAIDRRHDRGLPIMTSQKASRPELHVGEAAEVEVPGPGRTDEGAFVRASARPWRCRRSRRSSRQVAERPQ